MSKMGQAKIGAVLAALGVMLFFSFWQRTPNVAEVGGLAPDFTLPALDTGSGAPPPIHLYAHRGHVVLVNFWATWCPPCVEEAPSLENFSAQMQKMGVEVIGVSVDEDPEALKKFVAQYHLTFPIARDPNQIASAEFGTYKFPETYILDRDGRVAEKIISARDWTDPLMISFVQSLARPHQKPAR
ncbi:MAG TPA: TlpA disulfide reductase family protein [Terriglobia bacterium]|nr:TlpA disulfide reductase family protein [Terriglobia bacterium]